VHLAARPRALSLEDPHAYVRSNVTGTLNVWRLPPPRRHHLGVRLESSV